MKAFDMVKNAIDDAKTMRMEITLGAEEKLELAALGTELRKKVEEIADNVDYRWKITHWLFGIGIALNVISGGVLYFTLLA